MKIKGIFCCYRFRSGVFIIVFTFLPLIHQLFHIHIIITPFAAAGGGEVQLVDKFRLSLCLPNGFSSLLGCIC